ncbi:MAG: SpoIIE family protein phosphatase [Spirochaetales bacterium]|nr:SpoIIE family protein phosphatase [Spirochaetales bacterium]
MDLFYFAAFLLLLCSGIFGFHALRHRTGHGPYVAYVSFLWFLSFLTGGLNYRISSDALGFPVTFRYSSAIFTLIFVAILLVYICEGIKESRNLIRVSILIQLMLLLSQVFLFYVAGPLLSPAALDAATVLFEPRYFRLLVSILAAVIDLFFAVAFFQFLVNTFRRLPLGVQVALALLVTMFVDSLLFISLTQLEGFLREDVKTLPFLETLFSHVVFKSLIVLGAAGPFALYIRWFEKRSHLNLNRGTLDIFKKIEDLQEDLRKANEELREYAERLEIMVEERTQQIREKQSQIEYELAMAADVQRAMLPEKNRMPGLTYATRFLPCSAVSGDLYDLGRLDDRHVFLFMADISGHGMPSALIGAMTKMSISRINLHNTMPGNVLARLSRTIEKVTDYHYLTGIFINIDTAERELTYASGAHVPAALVNATGQITLLDPTGSIIGSALSGEFGMRRAHYGPNMRLVVYTDCCIEHKNRAREEYGMARFQHFLTRTRQETPEDTLTLMEEELRAFGEGQPFTDDFTVVIVDLP